MSELILSVFNLLKRVGFAVFLLGGSAIAQPFDVLWDRSGQGPESGYGARVFSLGDQNNDGFMDWGVTLQGLVAGDPSESIGEFFYGGNSPQSIPYHTWIADPGVYLRFVIVRPMGDLDGDGYVDWKVEFQPLQNTQTIEIGFYLGGPDATFEPFLQLSRPLSFSRIIPMGDFNGDGFDDIFAEGIQPYPDGYFLFGGELMDTIPDWLATRENFGMLTSGDVNGDGVTDFLSNGSDIYLGSANPDTAPAYHWGGGFHHSFHGLFLTLMVMGMTIYPLQNLIIE